MNYLVALHSIYLGGVTGVAHHDRKAVRASLVAIACPTYALGSSNYYAVG